MGGQVHLAEVRQAKMAASAEVVATIAFPLLASIYLLFVPLNHDVAWLLEASRRWINGAKLYRDIIEINPPLIFIENVLLTGGLLTKSGYLAGVAIAIIASSAWIGRWHGRGTGLIGSLVLTCVGIIGFGQRDHLCLIFLLPFLTAPDGLGRRERIALAAFGFLGVGLKPYFLLIPGAYVAMRCAAGRSLTPAWEMQNIVLGLMLICWVAAVLLIWPAYAFEVVPLGRFVYSAFGTLMGTAELLQLGLILTVSIIVTVRYPSYRPLAAATLGALLSYLIQGRFWSYHLIPALGLGAFTAIVAAHRPGTPLRASLLAAGVCLTALNPVMGPMRYPNPAIPQGVDTILYLADAVPVAYPAVVECGVINASRYPTFWTLPGAWNAMADPQKRHRAEEFFHQEIERGNADIRKYRPEIIYEDLRPPKFNRPFRFADWFDLSNYQLTKRTERLAIWLRRDLDPSILRAPRCSAWPSGLAVSSNQ